MTPYKLTARLPAHTRAMALVLIIVAVVLVVLVVGRSSGSQAPAYVWNFGVVWQYMPLFAEGFSLTAQITVVTVVLGLFFGLLVALGRLAPWIVVRAPVIVYIEIMRGTPILIQLVWVYYALPILVGYDLPAFAAVVVALTMNYAAFYGEAFRSGIQGIPRAQLETAHVLGLSYWQRMRYVIVPQAYRLVLPVLISLSISLFKDTSLVSTLGVADLMYNGRLASTDSYRPLEILTTVAAIYFAVAFPLALLLRRLELRLGRSTKIDESSLGL